MKSVMYHYVRKKNKSLPNFRFLDVKNFKRQLDFFQKNFNVLNKEKFLKCIELGKFVEKSLILTFDDSLKDHFNFVFPELIKRDVCGIFYIPTMPYASAKFLDVHRIHLLLGWGDSEIVLKDLSSVLTDDMMNDSLVEEFRSQTYLKQKNSDSVGMIKKILNYYINYSYRSEILDFLFKKYSISWEIENFYLSKDEMKKMSEFGMIMGSHSITHPVFSKLSKEDQEWEIRGSFECLNEMVGVQEVKTFAYPYGGFHTFSGVTERILSENHVDFSFNVESRDIEINDFINRPQSLPRYDCNEFRFGEVS